MKLKNSYILLIVMAIFLLVSIGSVCANDDVSDVALADDGLDDVLANSTGDTQKTDTEIISQDNVEINETAPKEIDLTVNDKNSSSKIDIGQKNLTIKDNKDNKTLKFDYANDTITIKDNLIKGKHPLLIEYLGNANYTKSNKTIILTILGNYSIETPDSINVNSSKKVTIPVNVTNGKDSKAITENDFSITLSYKEGNVTNTTSIQGLRYDNGKLTFNYNLADEITSSNMTIIYKNGTEEKLSKSLKLNRIYNAKIEVINNVSEYREWNFTFKLSDIDNNYAPLVNKTLLLKIGSGVTNVIHKTTDESGIATYENINYYNYVNNTFTIKELTAGNYSITLSTEGNINSTEVKTNLIVEKAKVTITIDPLNEYYGTNKKINITVKNSKSENLLSGVPIYFKVTDKNKNEIVYSSNGNKINLLGTNDNGTIELPVKNLIAGTYTVHVSLNDTDNYAGKSVDKTITINAIPIRYEVTAGTMYYNTGNTATIKVISKLNNKTVAGAIVIIQFDNDKNQVYGYQSDANGIVTVKVPLNVGKHSMFIQDGGEGRFTTTPITKNIKVQKASAKISAPKVTAYYKQGKYFTIKLTNTKNKKPIYYAKLNVRVYVTATKYYNYKAVQTGLDGKIKLLVDLKPGKYKVEIRGADSKNFAAKKVTSKITIKKAPTKLIPKKLTAKKGEKKYFKVTVKNKKTKKVIAGVKVKIKVYTGKKFKTYKVKTNKKGIAQLNVKSLKVGKHKVVVTSANKYCVAKAAKSTIKITKK